MRKVILILTIVFPFLIIGFSSCDGPTIPDDKYEIIYVNDNINSPTTWKTDKVYVIQKYNFEISEELIIEEGAIIKLSPEYRYITLVGSGKIIANGSSSKPIVFTSIKDDSNGGDTNKDKDETIPNAKDWGTIDLNGKKGSRFEYCEFRYGGFGVDPTPTLELSNGAEAHIENCKFVNNGGGAKVSGNITSYIGALHAADASKNTIIRNNVFYNNVLPLTIFAEIDLDNSNDFSYYSSKNEMNGVFVHGLNIMKTTQWQETEVAYVITAFDLVIMEPYKLVLGNDVVLKFVNNGRLNCGGGVSALENYNGQGVHFTSFKDDVRKGDTNGDGMQTSPKEADWLGVFLDDFKKAGNYADWPNIHYSDPNV
ncbi:MAG: hypothetical protein GX879_08580, partial [Bacteroidales bacterium]|nr:hypothetical protein [Bacteroidales bacterium]